MTVLAVVGLILSGIAALVHVFIFWMESFAWTSPRARAVFGTSETEAAATRELAFNQGFYNLFLAIAVLLGIIFVAAGQPAVGNTLVFTGAGSMVAASLVLLLSSPEKASAALKQGVIPALGVISLILGITL